MKIALVTDTHWGIRGDSQIFLDYFGEFYNNVFFPYLQENNIKTICHLGDIVDRRKFINYVTLRHLKTDFIDRCINDDIDLHVIVGNHDVPYKNTNEVNAMQELFDRSNIKYYSEAEDVMFDDTLITIMPWINSGNYKNSVDHIKNTPAQILFGHLEIAGCLMNRGVVNDHGMDVADFSRFDIVCSGHFHTKSTKNNVNYLGCPYELTWADYQDPKGFHIFDTETRELQFIENPYRMFHKLFYDDSDKTHEQIMDIDFDSFEGTFVKVVTQSKNNPYWFDMFMDKLYQSNPFNIQVVDDHLNLNLEDDDDIINEAEDTLTILSKYIDGIETRVPKKRLDNLMKSLYNEALHME